jgi:thiol-disulfide isomerase/thioredoxin
MEKFMKRVPKVMSGKKFWLVSALVVVLLTISIYFVYAAVKKPSYVANKEFTKLGGDEGNGNGKRVDVYFFHTSWCPHCKTAEPIWNNLKTEKPTVKGITINYIEVDCETDAATAEKFSVDGYPTIKLVTGNSVIEYDAKPELETLKRFIETSVV